MNSYSADEMREFAAFAGGWPALEELPGGLPLVAPFAYDLLPSALRPWIQDIAERMQCPPDYPAIAAVIGLASLVGRQIGIRPKAKDDWTVVPNLWGAAIGRPALLKTPAIQEPLRMVNALEVAARKENEKLAREHGAKELIASARRNVAKSRIAKALRENKEDAAQTIADETMEEVSTPPRKRYITQDPTVEKLGELLRDNPRGILIFRDELLGFLRTMEIEGRENSRAFYLEAWNGTGSYTYDRIGRGTVEIEAACVSIIGAIQPGPLRDYMMSAVAGGAGDDGLIQRFQLAVWPDAGREWVNVDRWPDTAARRQARHVYERLDHIEAAVIGAEQEEGDAVPWLRFSEDSQGIFNEWRENLEKRLREDDLHPAVESHLAKFRSLVPSLALLFHLSDLGNDNNDKAVGSQALLRALAWSEYLESHSKRVYAPALAPEIFAALELAKRLSDLPDPFTAKEVYRRHWRGLDIDGTKDAIQVLIDYGHIREMEDSATTGRPTVRYEIHPRLKGGKA